MQQGGGLDSSFVKRSCQFGKKDRKNDLLKKKLITGLNPSSPALTSALVTYQTAVRCLVKLIC